MANINDFIREKLLQMQDEGYRKFQCKLMPTVAPESVIGVRTPLLRSFAKQLTAMSDVNDFLACLPHKYYEENNLHGLIIERIKDYDEAIKALDAFLPYVDNWATCDIISPKVFTKHLPQLLCEIKRWIACGETYTVRFGIEMLMSFYLDGAFEPQLLDLVAGISSQEYYVNMMKAWFFATALAKQYDSTLPVLTDKKLDVWSHNKTIQKAIESYRITEEQKAYLRSLKIK